MLINALQNNSINNGALSIQAPKAAANTQQPLKSKEAIDAGPAASYRPSTLADYSDSALSPLQKKIVSLQNQIHALKDGKPLSAQQRKDMVNTLNNYLKDLQDGKIDSGKDLSPQQMRKQLIDSAQNNYAQLQYRINDPFSYLNPSNSFLGSSNNIFSTLDRGMDAMINNQFSQAMSNWSKRLDEPDATIDNFPSPASDPFGFISHVAAGVTNDKLSQGAQNRLAMANIYHDALSNLNAVSQQGNINSPSAHTYNRLA